MGARTFEDKPAVRSQIPLILGIVGCSGSGKTYSALRLAAGIQRAVGGAVYFIDTEARRALHYADQFKFRHIDFQPPFGPLDYLAAIEHCVAKGAKVIVIDSMTHEHNGIGGVMDQSETYLNGKCGDDEGARKRNFMLSLAKPKSERKRLNARIVQLGINAIFCYRAADKIKPVPGKEPEQLGWQPETTSPLVYEMAQQFLLDPGCDGVPTFALDNLTRAEKQLVKTPAQFRDWFKPGQRLDEDMGERMARWAAGDVAQQANTVNTGTPDPYIARLDSVKYTNLSMAWQHIMDKVTDPAKQRTYTIHLLQVMRRFYDDKEAPFGARGELTQMVTDLELRLGDILQDDGRELMTALGWVKAESGLTPRDG